MNCGARLSLENVLMKKMFFFSRKNNIWYFSSAYGKDPLSTDFFCSGAAISYAIPFDLYECTIILQTESRFLVLCGSLMHSKNFWKPVCVLSHCRILLFIVMFLHFLFKYRSVTNVCAVERLLERNCLMHGECWCSFLKKFSVPVILT